MLQPFSNDPFLPSGLQISHDLEISTQLVQLSLSALSLGFSMGTLFAGPVSDSIGRRRPLMAALAIYVVGTLLCAFAPNYAVFIVARILQGLAGSALAVVGTAILRDLYSGLGQIKATSRAMLVGSLSWFIGPSAGSLLLGFTNWRGIALIVLVVSVVFGLIAIRVLPETKPLADRSLHIFKGMGHRFGNVLKDRPFRGFVLTGMFINIGLMAYLGIIPLMFAKAFNVQSDQVGLFFAVNSFAAYLGVQSVGKLAQRFPAKWLLTGFLFLDIVVAAVMLAISPGHPSVWLYEAVLLVWIFVYGTSVTPIQALALQAHGEEAGTAVALMNSVGSMGPVFAAPLYTLVDKSSGAGLSEMLLFTSVLAFLSLMLVVRPWRLGSFA